MLYRIRRRPSKTIPIFPSLNSSLIQDIKTMINAFSSFVPVRDGKRCYNAEKDGFDQQTACEHPFVTEKDVLMLKKMISTNKQHASTRLLVEIHNNNSLSLSPD